MSFHIFSAEIYLDFFWQGTFQRLMCHILETREILTKSKEASKKWHRRNCPFKKREFPNEVNEIHPQQFCVAPKKILRLKRKTSYLNHYISGPSVVIWRVCNNYVTQLKLQILDKLSSSIFGCLWVSVSRIGDTQPNLLFFQYILAQKLSHAQYVWSIFYLQTFYLWGL